jgi:hypothetical protein
MKLDTKAFVSSLALAIGCTALPASATGLATCDSGPKSGWQPQEKLEKKLTDEKWQVRRIKEDGGCYEVYAINADGRRVEAYFHPVTLDPVPTNAKR